MVTDKKQKMRGLFYILICVILNNIVASAFYWLVDSGLYHYITSTVQGKENRIQAYTQWYASYDWLLLSTEFAILLLVTSILLNVLLKHPPKSIKVWFSRSDMIQLAAGLFAGGSAMSIVFFVLLLTKNARVISWSPNLSIAALSYLFVFVLVGLAEEFCYRGFVVTALGSFENKYAVILLSSIVFAAIHSSNAEFNLLAFFNITLIGGFLAYAFIESGSLWFPVGFHIFWNYFQGTVYGVNVSGVAIPSIFTAEYESYNLLNGGLFGPEGGLVVTVINLLLLLFTRWYFKNRNRKAPLHALS